MANPLAELKNLVAPTKLKTFTGVVFSISGEKAKVRLSTGSTIIVWGKAEVNDTVLVSGKQIVAVVGKEERATVHIP